MFDTANVYMRNLCVCIKGKFGRLLKGLEGCGKKWVYRQVNVIEHGVRKWFSYLKNNGKIMLEGKD